MLSHFSDYEDGVDALTEFLMCVEFSAFALNVVF